MATSTMWFGVDTAAARFEFYGGTTLATTIFGNGNIDVGGRVTASGQPRALVKNTADFVVSTGGTGTLVTWSAEDLDVGSMHSTSTNTGRLTVPTNGDGFYYVSAYIRWDGGTFSDNNQMQIRLRKNGSVIAEKWVSMAGSVAEWHDMISWGINAVATDYFEVVVRQNTGGNRNVDVLSRFEAIKLW